ncbi:MAG TPA: hypothetical protein EYH03_02655 [Chromatiales bacterium]|nr:hypothetical protein [Chromatiales bacterium]
MDVSVRKRLVYSLASGLITVSAWIPAVDAASIFIPSPTDIVEPSGLYYPESPDVLNVRVRTVTRPGPCVPGDYTGCTLDHVNNDTDPYDNFKPEIKVHFEADDFPDDGQPSNAELRQRGKTSRLAEQKSYRIKLDSKKVLWRDERKLQLNKHPWDLTRIRNKLSFDLMRDIPNLPSLRTQFVHLFIDDVDHGLYTHVENVGKEYLLKRNWDKDSPTYKAENFEFRMESALALDANGQPVDPDAFETILEIKRGDEHRALINMLQAVENEDNDVQADVIEKYFNRNNYLTWLAVNILMGNRDTINQNFYLHNPIGTERFYFLPWDYDDTWGSLDQPDNAAQGLKLPHWQLSIGTWWDIPLHRRFFQQPEGLSLITQAVTEIKDNYLTEARIQARLDAYRDLVYPLISQEPDVDYLPSSKDAIPEILQEYEQEYANLVTEVQKNYDDFIQHQEDPMPFWMDLPAVNDTTVSFTWDASVDLQGDSVTYDLEIATTPDFQTGTIVHSATGLSTPAYDLAWSLPKGDYYLRVTARDSADPQSHWQIAFDEIYDEAKDISYFGVQKFHVDIDGSGGISNLADGIVIDGDSSDWSGLRSFGTDANDVSDPANRLDWREGWMAHDSANLYIAYRNDGAIDEAKWWSWKLYLDLDKNAGTGFRSQGVGAEYMIEEDTVWRYTGDGDSWSWAYMGSALSALNGDFAEMTFPLDWIGNPSSIRFVFYGTNYAFSNIRENDRYPDTGYLTYEVSPVTEVLTSNPGASIDVDGSLDDWTPLTSFGSDPDDVQGAANRLDWLEGWTAHNGDTIYFAYRNQGAIDLDNWWAWHIFIDTDHDPDTGYGHNGAEYLLEEDAIWRYTGNGDNWAWQYVGAGQSAIHGETAEIAIPRILLGNPQRMDLLFLGNNAAFPGGTQTKDFYPDTGAFGYNAGN